MDEKTICILGAGPSGIVTALKLKQLGYSPLVLDYKKGTGNNMIQSLSRGVFTLLETVGIDLDEFHKTCKPIEKSLKSWNGEIIEIVNPPGFLTDRGQFDSMLRDIAKKRDINLLPDARVISIEQICEGWEICLIHDGKYKTHKAGFLVDASGKKSLIRGPKKRVAASTLAITGSWVDAGFDKNETRLESGNNSWCWGAMLSDGVFHATLFLDPELSKIPGGVGLTGLYTSYLKKTQLFKACLAGRVRGNLIANDVTPYYCERPADYNYIKVGESSVGLDPVSSQGIQSSMVGAVQAAIVINTLLADPKNASLAIEFYQERQQELIRVHEEKISAVYADAGSWQDNLFWSKRKMMGPLSVSTHAPESWTPSQRIEFSPDAALLPTGCIMENQVSSRTGLVHPLLKRPIVFWENLEIASILGTLQGRFELSEWIRRWSEKTNPVAAVRLYDQLKNLGVLVASRD